MAMIGGNVPLATLRLSLAGAAGARCRPAKVDKSLFSVLIGGQPYFGFSQPPSKCRRSHHPPARTPKMVLSPRSTRSVARMGIASSPGWF